MRQAMAVEIRELVIKTQITSRDEARLLQTRHEDLQSLKQQIIQECLKAIKESVPKNSFER